MASLFEAFKITDGFKMLLQLFVRVKGLQSKTHQNWLHLTFFQVAPIEPD